MTEQGLYAYPKAHAVVLAYLKTIFPRSLLAQPCA